MKYPRLTHWAYIPDAIHQWLEAELDNRGIDSTVYARYVLSVLQEDEDEKDEGYASSNSCQKLGTPLKQSKQCTKHQNVKRLHKVYNGHYDNFRNGKWCDCSSDDDDLSSEKKSDVIACLQSASEHCNDIESLVDQLQLKLREVKFEAWKNESSQYSERVTSSVDYTQQKSSPQEEAKQYFDAFPALNLKPSTKPSVVMDVTNDDQDKNNSWDGKRIIEVSKYIIENEDTENKPVGMEVNSLFEMSNVLHSEFDSSFMDWEIETLKNLESKFTSDVASIWEEGLETNNESKLSVWSYSSTSSPQIKKIWQANQDTIEPKLSSIWNGDSTSDLFANNTSLVNHGSNSLFVKVSPKPKPLNYNVDQNQLAFLQHPSVPDNLLTSAATHFQPIKQDYYEKEAGIVIDPKVKGMVPCSPKCPNKQRKKPVIEVKPFERSISISLDELESYIGPFSDCEATPAMPLRESSLNVSQIIETFGRCSNYSDKSTTTEENDGSISSNSTSGRWERWLLNKDGDSAQDFDVLCQLLDEVLQSHEKIITVEKNNLSKNFSDKKLSEKKSLDNSSDAMTESHFLALQEEIKREEAEIFADINKTTDSTAINFEEDDYFDENIFQDPANDMEGYDQGNLSIGVDPYYEGHDDGFSKNMSEMLEYNESFQCGSFESDHHIIEFKVKNGNCRRSDCKYSHDLKTITCKFWEEGSCFKGDSCPFLHGYDENLNRKSRRPSFTIESEQDFPSLSATDEFPELSSVKPIENIIKEKSEKPQRTSGKKRKKGQQRCTEKTL